MLPVAEEIRAAIAAQLDARRADPDRGARTMLLDEDH
jgi:hypothetical protein